MDKPLVSVIIPTYKRPDVLARAINSVLDQTYANYEIIVVDDNNPDTEERTQTETVMREYAENGKVKYIRHEKNKNGSAARNTGWKNSGGKYVMFLDDDDIFLPEKIEKQVGFMESHGSEWGASYTGYIDVFQNGKTRKGTEHSSGNMLVNELSRNFFVHAGSNLMVRRSIVEEIGGFDEKFERNQDIEFLVRVLKNYMIGFVDCLGLKVFLHPRKNIDYNNVTERFQQTFSEDIEMLSADEQKKVYTMLGLQLIRYNIGKKQFKKVWEIKKQYKVKPKYIVSYFLHLFERKVTATAHSYPMEKII